VLYHCPMHPTYTSDKPGECPICGMTLTLISADTTATGTGNVPGLTEIQLTPDRVQLIGVRTAIVQRRPLGNDFELVGFVTPDESRIRRVQIRVSGWVQELQVNRTGDAVRAGQPLLSIYSPELYQSEQEFLIEQGLGSDAGHAEPVVSPEAGGARLKLLGVPDEEVARLVRERKPSTVLTLRAPFTGTVLERGVSEGQYVSAQTPLFTVADLSKLWVLADLYEMDFTRVHVGDRVRLNVDALPGHSFEGRVEFIYPTVSDETRTLKLRVTVDNRDGLLRPGMYGNVHIEAGQAPQLAVPAEAVIHTGEHDYVFLVHAGGRFEPRLVQVGNGDGDWVRVLHGLAAGDTVAASGSFLIDSESRLRASLTGGAPANGAPEHHHQGATP
jgi:Cu(I)/Ag(I) efflux system membrane fusion protein